MDTNQSIATPSAKEPFNFMDFLQFKRMVTLQVIPILYAIVAVIITLVSLKMMFSGGSSSRRGYGGFDDDDAGFLGLLTGGGGFLSGLIFLIVGNVVWRMWCEFILVLFTVNKSLQNIDKNTQR